MGVTSPRLRRAPLHVERAPVEGMGCFFSWDEPPGRPLAFMVSVHGRRCMACPLIPRRRTFYVPV